jgi:hypothetical protein
MLGWQERTLIAPACRKERKTGGRTVPMPALIGGLRPVAARQTNRLHISDLPAILGNTQCMTSARRTRTRAVLTTSQDAASGTDLACAEGPIGVRPDAGGESHTPYGGTFDAMDHT